MYGFFSNFLFAIFKLDGYFLFKLKCYFLYFTLYVHSMPKLRIHFRLVLIIYWFISLHTCCYLARILRCSLLQWIYSNTLPKKREIKRAVQILPEVYGTSLSYLVFKYFGFERTWWRLSQKSVVCTKFDIYVFIDLFCIKYNANIKFIKINLKRPDDMFYGLKTFEQDFCTRLKHYPIRKL